MSATKSPHTAKQEQELITDVLSLANDPLKFVEFAFPWGKKGTPLEHEKGPRKWQKKKLIEITEFIAKCKLEGKKPNLDEIVYTVFKDATVSGRGVGKSAFVAWLILWFLSTRLGGTVVVSANSESQLKTKTWAELGRWHTMSINNHWFDKLAMSLKPAAWFDGVLQKQLKVSTGYYYAEAILWSEEKPDAFAGVHNPLGILLIFDEASGIPSAIWKVSQGFFTEKKCPDRYWFVFSNGRRNSGAFYDCFHKDREFWRTTQIDARTVEDTDQAVYEEIIKQHGEDSDEARVEVKGQFPRTGDKQFIGRELVLDAQERDVSLVEDQNAPLIMGVDPARFGSDTSVICFRQGRVNVPGFVPRPVRIKNIDNMALADKCAELILKYNPDAVCIDAGNGTGIIDRLRQLGFQVNEVWFGAKADESDTYANKRVELWAKVRDWLSGAALDKDPELASELTAPEYRFMGNSDRILLESKDDMKRRGFKSPDYADALACTFAVKVARRGLKVSRSKGPYMSKGMDYDLFNVGGD